MSLRLHLLTQKRAGHRALTVACSSQLSRPPRIPLCSSAPSSPWRTTAAAATAVAAAAVAAAVSAPAASATPAGPGAAYGMDQMGLELRGVWFGYCPGMPERGRGCFASESIPVPTHAGVSHTVTLEGQPKVSFADTVIRAQAGQVVLFLPQPAVISAAAARLAVPGLAAVQRSLELSDSGLLALYVLHLCLAEEKLPWLDVLPRRPTLLDNEADLFGGALSPFTTAVWWGAAAVDAVVSTPLAAARAAKLRWLEQLLPALLPALHDAGMDKLAAKLLAEPLLLRWADSVVWSRAVAAPVELAGGTAAGGGLDWAAVGGIGEEVDPSSFDLCILPGVDMVRTLHALHVRLVILGAPIQRWHCVSPPHLP